jgi:hypothetical protein
MRRVIIALFAGVLFGAGLAHSGMSDPTRVRAFLDLFGGAWDPTLAFVMGGAIVPMAVAWRIRRRLDAPLADTSFTLPSTTGITPSLIGLCPGPAIADFAIAPVPAAIFVAAMLGGMILHRLLPAVPAKRPPLETSHV